MAIERFHVVQDLVIEEVLGATSELIVRLRDSRGSLNMVRYEFRDVLERELHRTVLEAWRIARTPLTYIKRGGEGTLVDDEMRYRTRSLDMSFRAVWPG